MLLNFRNRINPIYLSQIKKFRNLNNLKIELFEIQEFTVFLFTKKFLEILANGNQILYLKNLYEQSYLFLNSDTNLEPNMCF